MQFDMRKFNFTNGIIKHGTVCQIRWFQLIL